MRPQIAASKVTRGGRRYRPYAFTEHGVAMLSSVLTSQRAVQMSVLIVRAFVRLRELLATHKGLARAVRELQRKQEEQDAKIATIFEYLDKLLAPPKEPRRRIGFTMD